MSKSSPLVAGLCILALAVGCSSDDIVDPDKLCKEGAGLAARIDGTQAPIDMCVPDDQTSAFYETAPAARYTVSGTFTSGSLMITIDTEFLVHPSWPVQLVLTPSAALAQADPNFVYFSYHETDSGVDLSSMDVTGNFVLTFSDASIAVGSFSDVTITLQDTAAPGTAVGTRMISEGFVSVTAD